MKTIYKTRAGDTVDYIAWKFYGSTTNQVLESVLANQADITSKISNRLISLRYTDEAGMESNMLEITLADHDPDNPIQVLTTGAELGLFLGYDGKHQRIGMFVCDEVELAGWPGEMTIRARAAPFDVSKGGLANLQS